MRYISITGKAPLRGTINISGMKNAALPILFATLLIKESVSVITNLPPIKDVETALKILEHIPCFWEGEKDSVCAIYTNNHSPIPEFHPCLNRCMML